MAPSPIRQLLAWSLPSVAVLLSYLWYKKRRIGARSDTGGSEPLEEESFQECVQSLNNSIKSEPVDVSFKTADQTVRANCNQPLNVIQLMGFPGGVSEYSVLYSGQEIQQITERR